MSWQAAIDPKCEQRGAEQSPIETVILPRARDLGGFEVRRALPSSRRQMVGPFIFFDQMGPSEFLLGQGIDVRPHPHIGLATVTYLLAGEIIHRDSLGTLQPTDVATNAKLSEDVPEQRRERTTNGHNRRLSLRCNPLRGGGSSAYSRVVPLHGLSAPRGGADGWLDDVPAGRGQGDEGRTQSLPIFGTWAAAFLPQLWHRPLLHQCARDPRNHRYSERNL
jgi:hypothetical protein